MRPPTTSREFPQRPMTQQARRQIPRPPQAPCSLETATSAAAAAGSELQAAIVSTVVHPQQEVRDGIAIQGTGYVNQSTAAASALPETPKDIPPHRVPSPPLLLSSCPQEEKDLVTPMTTPFASSPLAPTRPPLIQQSHPHPQSSFRPLEINPDLNFTIHRKESPSPTPRAAVSPSSMEFPFLHDLLSHQPPPHQNLVDDLFRIIPPALPPTSTSLGIQSKPNRDGDRSERRSNAMKFKKPLTASRILRPSPHLTSTPTPSSADHLTLASPIQINPRPPPSHQKRSNQISMPRTIKTAAPATHRS